MIDEFKTERDCLAALGLLASNALSFDSAVQIGGTRTHVRGFNVHCLVVDNADGEVLALGRNRIHEDWNPLQHAEQVVVRAAVERLKVKRPRPVGVAVERYYKTQLFMEPGTTPADFVDRGCTLYNTFDPCGMCAVTLLVCYMKRIAYLFEDEKFATVYETMRGFFKGRDSVKEAVAIAVEADGESFLAESSRLIRDLRKRVAELEEAGTPLVETLDACREQLQAAAELLAATTPERLVTKGTQRERNVRTLTDLKRRLNL